MTHTPTPWRVEAEPEGGYSIEGADGESVMIDTAYYPVTPTPENAAFIVRAVNSHDKLVEALRYYASAEAWMSPQIEGPDGDYGMRARAALEGLE